MLIPDNIFVIITSSGW